MTNQAKTLIVITSIVLLIGVVSVGAVTIQKKKSETLNNPLHIKVQNRINEWLNNPTGYGLSVATALNTGIKEGGAHGVKANSKTTKQYIFDLAKISTVTNPNDSYDAYNYPGLQNYVNENAKDGLGRDSSGSGINTGAIIKGVTSGAIGGSVIPGAGNIVGAVIGGLTGIFGG